jgi:hypothetical protein
MFCIRPTPTPNRLVIRGGSLFAILAAEALALLVVALAATLQFDNFAFLDPGANLTVQYLISHGYSPTIDFFYHYGLLPLLFGRVWFSIFGLTPIACVALVPLLDIIIIWGFVRFAANLKLNLAGILIILLTGSLTIPSGFLNLAHGMEPIFLLHALAFQAGGNRRRALALAAACLFVKPSMAYFFGLVLLVFIVIADLRDHERPLRSIVADIYPATLVVIAIAAILVATFGFASAVGSMIPSEGFSAYRALGYGFFSGAGRSFLAPIGAPWLYYLANVAGPWIAYTIALAAAALVVLRRALADVASGEGTDRTPELLLTCAISHLSFIMFFFGNEFSWGYYFYIPVLGLAAAARLGIGWEVLVACLAFALPITKVDKRVIQRFAFARQEKSANAESYAAGLPAIPASPVVSPFTYQLWFTTSPSAETAGLWVTPDERAEWIKVLAMTRGHRTAILDYYGCADILFPEFSPPVTLFLVPGGASPAEISRKILQLEASSMIVMPRGQNGLLDDIPAIGNLVRRDFVAAFQGAWFVVYARRKGLTQRQGGCAGESRFQNLASSQLCSEFFHQRLGRSQACVSWMENRRVWW